MKSIAIILTTTATALLITTVEALAGLGIPVYKFDSGTCDNGKSWASVSCYIAGRLVWIEGVDCDGKSYRRWDCNVVPVSSDPTLGLIPTHSGECEAGMWRAVIVRDGSGYPFSAAGVGCDGAFYIVDSFLSEE